LDRALPPAWLVEAAELATVLHASSITPLILHGEEDEVQRTLRRQWELSRIDSVRHRPAAGDCVVGLLFSGAPRYQGQSDGSFAV
jgi:hypothetical protein